MTALTFSEQSALARMAVERARRLVVARMLRSRALRWKYGAAQADQLLLVPQELRTADPSFAHELEQGLFGLGGAVAHIGDGSVFDLPSPSPSWARELHGFGWLRHLRAAQVSSSQLVARETVIDWIGRYSSATDRTAWQTDVVGRRIISWISSAEMLLEDVTPDEYDRITDSLGSQLIRLWACRGDSAPGYPRLVILVALMTGALCVSGHNAMLGRIEPLLGAELDRQLMEDGGHISRNPAIVVELLLDLLPLRTCFQARKRRVPELVERSIERMLRFVRFLRLGDGSLGRFNGMGATPFDSLAILLGYDPAPEQPLAEASASQYARMVGGDIVVLADIGGPPPLEAAGQAAAGALSFELSVGAQAVFVNGGTPGPAEVEWQAASRATAAHNTLVLGARSSARMVESPLLTQLVGGAPLRFPSRAGGRIEESAGQVSLVCEHDGYVSRFGLVHKRTLSLAKSGARLEGEDHVSSGQANAMRLPHDVPFSVHFHVHPEIVCRLGEDPGLVTMRLPHGDLWYFRSEKATISIEDSIHFADLVGPRNAQQIVLRGACFGDTKIRWSFSRLGEIDAP
jgi:uncharacterized heparinase superfamily protein